MMEVLHNLIDFVSQEPEKLFHQTLVHSGLTFISVSIAIIISVPLGVWVTRKTKWAGPVIGICGIFQTIPSIALLGFMIPFLGIGTEPAIVALFLYALLPIIRNTYTGIMEVDTSVKEAAVAMGMTSGQVFWKIEFPLAFPVILAGIRTATVINVGVATLAAYIGAGGLGEFIFGGIALNNSAMILAGAIPATLLALLFDFLLSRLEHLSVKKIKRTVAFIMIGFVILASLYFVPTIFGSKLVAGFPPEFMGRSDGYKGLKNKYGLKIDTRVVNEAMLYKAIKDKRVDVISGYSTDGRIKAFDLKILKDDKHLFPPYYAAPLVRKSTLKKYPKLKSILNLLAGKINDSLMTQLNYQADFLKKRPEAIAQHFLKKEGLYLSPKSGNKGTIIIGSKIFSEQYILAEIYAELIEGHSNLKVITKNGLGGTKICFSALENGEIDFYPEYTGTGLQVILKAPQDSINKIILDKEKVYKYVKEEFKKKYNLEWLQPIGFNNTYAILMREKQAKKLNINSISDLKNYISK